ncbi:MAG: phage holin family protein [Hamadaea sp.]|nr:phage holin family protein [Hamadaea sp.]
MTDLRHRHEASSPELVRQATDQITTLVRQEMQLARAELTEKGKRLGIGVGLFTGAGVTVFYAVGALLFALGLGLAEAMPAWLAALVVAVLLLVVAGVQTLIGRAQVKRGTPITPTGTVESVKADLDAIGSAVEEGRSR